MTRSVAIVSLAAFAACAAPSRPLLIPAVTGKPVASTAAPAWTNGGTCYEVFVRSFYDSNGDGIGDLQGLIQKLDYINDGNPASTSSLGASCIWLMPVAVSPSYHGYDVSDYYTVQPAYGTNDDFKRLVAEAHRRGIAVLVDMVLNHSSSAHPYFQAALRDTTSTYRSWYRFSPTSLGVGPWGAEAWHLSPVGNEFYYGVFSSDMPDLNYQTDAVRAEAKRIAAYWLQQMGVDGFRLDAIPYLVEEGGCLMGCPGTHAFLREYAAYVSSIAPAAYTVGEAWGNIDSIMPYYPDQLTSQFAFELSDSLLGAVRRGSVGGMLAGYIRLQDTLPGYRWSPFLTNHDQTRTMTALGGDPALAKEAATLLLTLPGFPFVYYGEEIGMSGDKPDPRLRTPMQWSSGNAGGFTSGTPWEDLQPDVSTINVATESANVSSLLSLYRQLIHLRTANVALATGRLVSLYSGSNSVAAYLRTTGTQAALVVVNLGATAASAPTLVSGVGVLSPGTYTAQGLLGGRDGAALVVASDGSFTAYAPISGQLGPHQSAVFSLIHR
jgi:glycosidase